MAVTPRVVPVERSNLTMKVYAELEAALFEGRLHPGQRLKIRDLAAGMGVSETPIREAIMQLARVGAVRFEAARAITVAGLTHDEYLELRTIRLELEGLAAETAARRITPAGIAALEAAHAALTAAEAAGEGAAANKANWAFHRGLYAAAGMPQLSAIIDTVWLRNGPVHAFHYPEAPPAYPGRHRHLDILDALRAGDPQAARAALRADLMEGGRALVEFLRRRDAAKAGT
ncbi:GntR family transcriptional regulator [Pseudoroseomonas cervicalis]|uniref:GntR family transcriptional regulator n=1 Tax=Teichococcus cervicalis TaxID=204525 RepID=UPI0027870B0F|nr:GntR family transcriptional regulator [Pseudoroseomonas cervicalis]MDQ1081832.1 DNA-binding GntR family transcriptional regulator [Pseudoroseomonas cervicalis]